MILFTNEDDLWSLSKVDWQCLLKKKPERDIYYDCDCVVNFNDLAYFTHYWLERLKMANIIYLAGE